MSKMNIQFQYILHLAGYHLKAMSDTEIMIMKQKLKLIILQLRLQSCLRKIEIATGDYSPYLQKLEVLSTVAGIVQVIKV